MRLIHATTVKLVEDLDYDLPPYAILSHTWGTEGVSFVKFDRVEAKKKQGWTKIASCCETVIK